MIPQVSNSTNQLSNLSHQIKTKSDELINYFLIGYFILGLFFAFTYDTWLVAIGSGGLCLLAYYSAKFFIPTSDFYQYVLSAVLGIFMAQYIYQMHGLFEMHFVAFISSALLITYQNWKLQIPLGVVIVVHHGLFAYLQFAGAPDVYFTQLDYMNVQTFIIHVLFALIIIFICGLWAHQLEKYSDIQIKQANEIEKANSELRKSNLELDKFVYSVSHDLRAPLSSVLGIIQIAEDDTNDGVMLEQLGMMKKSITKLDGFVVDILDYSRNTRQELNVAKVQFKEMLDEIVQNLKYMSKASSEVEMQIHINDSGYFKSDPGRLNVVLNNLISNAIRYSNPVAPNPMVQIMIEANELEAKIKVKDNGIGIRKDLQDKVFHMFYRVSESSNGSGLGLYIVKEAVEKLNGQINLESEPGIGSEFTLTIPGNN